jgi:hypothetical protein
MACEQLLGMRVSLRQLREEAKRGRGHAREAERNDRRSQDRGGSDALVYMERRLHRATTELEQHIIFHRCQD